MEKINQISDKEKEQKMLPSFLSNQILLPKEEWSEEFKTYINEKIKENLKPKKSTEETSEKQEQQETFNRYLKGLGLTEADLKDKAILDLGSGEGEFIEECLDKKLSDKVYGLDAELSQNLKEKHPDNFIEGSFANPIPVKDADYVISVGSLSNLIWQTEDYAGIKNVFKNALNSLNEKGELRIFPIQKSYPESELKGIENSYKKWLEILQVLSEDEKISWELKPVDIVVGRDENDIWLNEVLIIKKLN